MCNQEKEIFNILTKHAKYELSIELRKEIAHELWLRQSKLITKLEEEKVELLKLFYP